MKICDKCKKDVTSEKLTMRYVDGTYRCYSCTQLYGVAKVKIKGGLK